MELITTFKQPFRERKKMILHSYIKVLLLTLALLVSGCFNKAHSQVDSLLDVLSTTRSDSIRLDCYLEISKYYIDFNSPDSSIIYAEKGIKLAKENGMKPDIRFYRLLVSAYDNKRQYKQSLEQVAIILKILKGTNDPTELAWLTDHEGWYHFRMGEFTESIESFEKAKILAEELSNHEILADAYLGLGRVYYSLRDYELEELNYNRFLEYVDIKNEKHLVFYILSRLGDIQREDGRFDESNVTYNRLVDLAKEAGDTVRVANTLNRMAWGYYEKGRLEESLEIYLKDLEISKQIGNKRLITNCLGNIGNIYRDWNYFEKAIEYYTLSIEVSKEIDDIFNLAWLYKDISAMYANMGRYELAYEHFMLHSAYNDTLMSDDYNRRIVQAQAQYEVEKSEKELAVMQLRLQRNNYLMYGIGGLSLVFIIIAILFFRSHRLRSRQRLEAMNLKVSDLTQKNLRTQMNPHFIFNTLNSIQYYVFENDRIASNNYMTKFAKLIRKTLENSEHPAIPISEEMDALELYLELESLRFKKKFDWSIDIDEDIDTYMYKIPTMLIQPFVENAIGHGLMHKTGKGYIKIEMKLEDECIMCAIEDNGIGRKKAMEIKNNKKDNHKSLGTSITESRLKLVNSLYGKSMKVEYTDMKNDKGEASGTRVEICIPIIT